MKVYVGVYVGVSVAGLRPGVANIPNPDRLPDPPKTVHYPRPPPSGTFRDPRFFGPFRGSFSVVSILIFASKQSFFSAFCEIYTIVLIPYRICAKSVGKRGSIFISIGYDSTTGLSMKMSVPSGLGEAPYLPAHFAPTRRPLRVLLVF